MSQQPADNGLAGLTVLSFESRHAVEMAELIRRHGGTPLVVPSMRELPLTENTEARRFLDELERGAIDVAVFLTGVGTRALFATLAADRPAERIAELLGPVTLVARGPKAVAALRGFRLAPTVTAAEPNTWREVLHGLDEHASLRGKRVAVQEYGIRNPELIRGLEERGASVIPVPVYRWALPEDPEPLRRGVRQFAAGEIDVVVFTSATQVYHVMQVAEEFGLRDALTATAKRLVLASIGPICSEAIRECGLPVDIEPEHSKMGQLVLALAQRARDLLDSKRCNVA